MPRFYKTLDPSEPTPAFRFLHLPPEIRSRIYIISITSPSPYVCLSPLDISFRSRYPSYPHQLLRVCNQIYHEVRPLYFTQNPFTLSIRRYNVLLSYYLAPDFRDNLRLIRSLRVEIVRWGSKDFFTRVFIPALADCILNGNLRRLEVLMKNDHVPRQEGEEGKAWRALKALLNDPYLERVTIRAGPSLQYGRDDEEVEKDKYRDIAWHLEDSGSVNRCGWRA